MDDAVTGLVGTVVVAIRGAAGPGEILLQVRGSTEAWLAYAEEAIPAGAQVVVLESRSGRAVTVARYP